MKAAGRFLGMAAVAVLAACAPRPAPAPPVGEVIPPPPAPPAPPVDPAADAPEPPISPGEWLYQDKGGGTEAWYDGAESNFLMRCDLQRQRILLTRGEAPSVGAAMTIRTSSGSRTISDSAELPVSDPFLDAIVFSRGRFTVETAGLPSLVVPAWPEPGRVVEDCRP